MLPNLILIDDEAPEDGALVFEKYMTVRESNKEKLMEGLGMVNKNAVYTILSKKEYLKGLNETYTKAKRTDTGSGADNQC